MVFAVIAKGKKAMNRGMNIFIITHTKISFLMLQKIQKVTNAVQLIFFGYNFPLKQINHLPVRL